MKKIKLCKSIFILLLLFLSSCNFNDLKDLKKKKIKVDKITRLEKDHFFDFNEPKQKKLEAYPFEENLENISKITKEYFRCKGNPLNPERIDESDPDNIKVYLDCEGSSKHSLPLMHNNKEGVYPILIDILNYIQKKTKKKVIITCGHRCPKHNQYSDFDSSAKLSKHLIGAEVDFYVEGYEQKYLEILNL
ncbi:MAG: DUF882 domain-containing protein, partial [Parachlamydiales bacterium]|nr:DUF882 domain-containing protein [Parachlamydiales bacterium]